MSRSAAPRQLSLPEELERLEQQITLTLQEIDSNFSKAHRIVTSSILPIVEDYAKHSANVWEGSKFWKQFFEASANVSLSGYEEAALEDKEEEEEEEEEQDGTEFSQTPTVHEDGDVSLTPDTSGRRAGAKIDEYKEEEFSLDSPTQVTGVQSTPRLPTSASGKSRAHAPPKSSLRSPSPRKYTRGQNNRAAPAPSDTPSTPRLQTHATQQSSPFEPESGYQPSARRQQAASNNDPLMHRGVLDRNYRIQATPHTQQRRSAAPKASVKPTPESATRETRPWDDSPQSSPVIAAPQLRSDLFSPVGRAPRAPGVSVMTPAARRTAPSTSTGRQLFSPQDKVYASAASRASQLFTSSDDEDADGGFDMSPPKTMQFHVPQSRLMQTPAREASRRIVEDLLLTAGAEGTEEIEAEGVGLQNASPSVVRKVFEDDDTF
nr:dash complex subunit ask1 [Quercus suber]